MDYVILASYATASQLEAEQDDPSCRDMDLADLATPQTAWVFPTQILTDSDWGRMQTEVETELFEDIDPTTPVIWSSVEHTPESRADRVFHDSWVRRAYLDSEHVATIVAVLRRVGVGA